MLLAALRDSNSNYLPLKPRSRQSNSRCTAIIILSESLLGLASHWQGSSAGTTGTSTQVGTLQTRPWILTQPGRETTYQCLWRRLSTRPSRCESDSLRRAMSAANLARENLELTNLIMVNQQMCLIYERLKGTGLIQSHLVLALPAHKETRLKMLHHGHLALSLLVFQLFLAMEPDMPFEDIQNCVKSLEPRLGRMLLSRVGRINLFQPNEQSLKLLVGLLYKHLQEDPGASSHQFQNILFNQLAPIVKLEIFGYRARTHAARISQGAASGDFKARLLAQERDSVLQFEGRVVNADEQGVRYQLQVRRNKMGFILVEAEGANDKSAESKAYELAYRVAREG